MSVDNDPRVEIAAKALHDSFFDADSFPWEQLAVQGKYGWREYARVVLAAVDAVNPPPRYEQVGWHTTMAEKTGGIHWRNTKPPDVLGVLWEPVFVRVSDEETQ